MAYSDRELLARIVQCEAGGEGDNGMKAVASVTMYQMENMLEFHKVETSEILFFNKGNMIVQEKPYEISTIRKTSTI